MAGIRLNTLLILAVLASGIVALLPFAWSGTDALSSSGRESALRAVEASAKLLALSLPSGVAGRDAAGIARLANAARAASGARYTVILRDGAVLADSHEDPLRMENHANRPEIRAALEGETRAEIRNSPTLGDAWIFAAAPLPDGNVVRAAASMAELDARLAQWWRRAFLGFAVSLAVLLAMAVFVARRLSKPLETAAAGAERYAAGDFSFRVPVSGSAEMRRLSESMGAMAGELDARFKLITRQRGEMRSVFETMSEGVLAVDGSEKILLSNAAAEAMLGHAPSDSGRFLSSAVRNADLLDALRETAASGEPLEREIRIRRDASRPGSQDETLLLAHTARMREGGNTVGVLAVLRDVTRLRRLEVMRRDFVANVSHELRTPITTLQSCLETLREEGGISGESEGFLDMALRNTRRMGAIVTNLLFLAGMESPSREEGDAPAVHPVRPVLDDAVRECREEALARAITVEIDCGDGVTALMNPRLVAHAVVNLVDNAIKYGPENGVITVSARVVADGGTESTEIVVSDQGPGIPPRHRSRVFERFYRVDGLSRIQKGSGLGLAIVKHIAQSQGGDIRLESEIGAGSTFRLRLPRA